MFLQTLFALSSLVPAITAFAPSPLGFAGADAGVGVIDIHRSAITIMGSRRFTAQVFAPRSGLPESRYPGAIVIATEATRDRAFLMASRMAEIGVTVIMYTQQENAYLRLQVYDAQAALDSMRHRNDVRKEEIGIIALESATSVVPNLIRDTTISFAIAASGDAYGHMDKRYKKAHAATLVVQGVDSLGRALVRPLPPEDADTALEPAAQQLSEETGLPKAPTIMAPNVTLWPVPKEELEEIGEMHSPLGKRVVIWIQEQVHATPMVPQLTPITSH